MNDFSPRHAAARLGKVTASRIADIQRKGKDGQPSGSREKYKSELISQRLTGQPTPSFQTRAMLEGIEREADARAMYEAHQLFSLIQQTEFHDHPTIAWAGASPDALVDDDGLAQFKCPELTAHIAWYKGGSINGDYRLQMQWELACTQRLWCDFVSYSPSMPTRMQLVIRRVKRDARIISELEHAAIVFLDEVAAEVECLLKLDGGANQSRLMDQLRASAAL